MNQFNSKRKTTTQRLNVGNKSSIIMPEVTSDVKTTLDTLNFMAIMISQGRLKMMVSKKLLLLSRYDPVKINIGKTNFRYAVIP